MGFLNTLYSITRASRSPVFNYGVSKHNTLHKRQKYDKIKCYFLKICTPLTPDYTFLREGFNVKCLIIAAGQGSRLSEMGSPKPLIPLLGLTLIERVVYTMLSAGIDEFYVVSGYEGERLRAFLDELSRKKNIQINHITNKEWDRANGVSVWKAKEFIKEPFILSMSDHVFDADIVKELINQPLREDEIILAVDTNLSNKLIDIEDVTKVLTKEGKIIDIGKQIRDYNAYDTGIFFCSPAIFNALEKSISSGDESLSGGIKELARTGKARTFDIGKRLWIDVDDKKAYKKAKKYMLKSLTKATDGPISKYLNRPISTLISSHLVKTQITPNQISVFSFALSILGALLFSIGSYIPLLIGGILAQFASIIDGCDGEIARLKFQSSGFGGWFDAVLDRYADAALLLGLTYNAYLIHSTFSRIFIGFLAIIGTFMNSYTADKYDGFMKKRIKEGGKYIRFGRDVRIFIIFIGALLNQALWTLIIIAAFMNIENIKRVVVLYEEEKHRVHQRKN